MSGRVLSHLTISLDGFGAGPDQSSQNPLGIGAERLHEWLLATATFQGEHPGVTAQAPTASDADEAAARAMSAGIGAYVMGRNMFSPGRGEWDLDWRGWWGENPPYHTPVFVLTHHAREPLEMDGGTRFEFVTDGIEAALERARTAAGAGDVAIAGGPATVDQYLAAGLLDELHLHVAPIVLGAGERLFAAGGEPKLEPLSAAASARAVHVSYRVVR